MSGISKDMMAADCCVFDPLRLVRVSAFCNSSRHGYFVRLLWGIVKMGEPGDTMDQAADDTDRGDTTDQAADDTGQGDTTEQAADDTGQGDTAYRTETSVNDSETAKAETAPVNINEVSEKAGPVRKNDTAGEPEDFEEPEEPEEPAEPDYDIEDPEDVDNPSSGKREHTPGRFEKINDLVRSPGNRRAVCLIFKEGMSLLKRVMPHLKEADGIFSAGEPDITGRLIGVMAVFPVMYNPGVRISGDFESDNIYARGHIVFQGRIQLFFFLASAVRIIASKDCRRLYRMIKAL